MLKQQVHKAVMLEVLKSLYNDPQVGPFLGFKGGTAALLFYGLDRFSVDLDFDLLEPSKEDELFERIKTILEGHGTLKESRKKRFNLFYFLSYDGKDPNAQNLKIEINRREFGSSYSVESHLGMPMKVMLKEDMVAHKLVAMKERLGKTNRDIFDVYFFLKNKWPINRKIVEERTGLTFSKFLDECITALEKFEDQSILSGLGELLTEKQKPWVKTKLKDEALFQLRLLRELEKPFPIDQ